MLLKFGSKYINTDNVLWYNVQDLTMLIYLGKDNTIKTTFENETELIKYVQFLEAVHGGFISGIIYTIRHTSRLLLKLLNKFSKKHFTKK